MNSQNDFYNILAHAEAEAIKGIPTPIEICLTLADMCHDSDELLEALCDAADRVRHAHCGDHFDTCSIINGRSGRCSENCKWCAQAASHHTGCEEYLFVDDKEFDEMVRRNDIRGVGRFSIVCSGRKVGNADVRRFCDMYRRAKETSSMSFCASMGLLGLQEMQQLYAAGVRRYHCNLETAASFFPALCTSHNHEDKLRTIRAAQQAGLQVCSGGIIGMGETLRQRLELAQEVREAGAVSMPINLLNPIKGTPLENTPLLSERDVILSCALMRMVAPTLVLRFAGGRARLSEKASRRILRGGVNGAIMGDMLTTIGNGMDTDFKLFHSLGYTTRKSTHINNMKTSTPLQSNSNYVITIGRQFGSGGRELGHKLAERLGIGYYDKELLAQAAEKAGMSREVFESTDERMPKMAGSSVGFSMGFGQLPWYNGMAMITDSIYTSLADVMEHLAQTQPCVIVGRSADFVLRNSTTPVVSVFVHAPINVRVDRILARNDKATEKEARTLAEKTDKLRASYYNFYTDKRWGDSTSYDLTFNSSVISMDDMVDLIAEYIRRRFGIEPKRCD